MTNDPFNNEKIIFRLVEDTAPPPTPTPAEQAEHDQWQAKSADLAKTITQLVLSGHLAAESGHPRASYALAAQVTELITKLTDEDIFGVIVYLAHNLGQHLVADEPQLVEQIKDAYAKLDNITGQDTTS